MILVLGFFVLSILELIWTEAGQNQSINEATWHYATLTANKCFECLQLQFVAFTQQGILGNESQVWKDFRWNSADVLRTAFLWKNFLTWTEQNYSLTHGSVRTHTHHCVKGKCFNKKMNGSRQWDDLCASTCHVKQIITDHKGSHFFFYAYPVKKNKNKKIKSVCMLRGHELLHVLLVMALAACMTR